MTTYISRATGQFTYFDRRFRNPDWNGKRLLDFGGNVGNLLLDPNCRIKPENYWSMDISRDAITEGARRHPEAHFIFYDRYNYEYNPTGTPGLPIPDPGVRFDYIVANSVVTHNNKADSLELIDQLMSLLTDDGRLAFTFLDPTWTPSESWVFHSGPNREEHREKSNLRKGLERLSRFNPELDVARSLALAESRHLTWVTLVDSKDLVIDPDSHPPAEDRDRPVEHRLWGYINYYTAEFISELFPSAEIIPPHGDRQHCAILDARKQ